LRYIDSSNLLRFWSGEGWHYHEEFDAAEGRMWKETLMSEDSGEFSFLPHERTQKQEICASTGDG
jgi:hypothetical protein